VQHHVALIVIDARGGASSPLGVVEPDLGRVLEAIAASAPPAVLLTRDARAHAVARSARLALGAERVGILHRPVPVTAWALVLRGLASMPPQALTGAGGVADAMLSAMRTRAVLSSVTALTEPAPSFGQYMASFGPSSFEVDLTAGTVTRRHGPVVVGGVEAAVASSGSRVPKSIARDWPGEPLVVAGVGSAWRASWWMEITSMAAPTPHIVHHVLNDRARFGCCDTCGRWSTSPECLFCDLALISPPLREGAPA